MLDSKLKTLERKILDEETKKSQILILNKRSKNYMKKQKFSYSVTLVLFALLLFVFSQTIGGSSKSIQSQQQPNFELGQVTKAYYIYSKRADRMYNLTSPFYSDKLSTTDQAILNEFERLFKNNEVSPFTGDLTNYQDSTHYLFQLENGESVYLKEINDGANSFFVIPNTMMEIKLPEENHEQFGSYWMHIYMGKNEFPPWKIGTLTVLLLILFYESYKIKKSNLKQKNSLLINVSCLGLTFFCINQMIDWLGVNHLLTLLIIITVFLTAAEYLHIIIKKHEPNWNLYIRKILMANLILFVLFI